MKTVIPLPRWFAAPGLIAALALFAPPAHAIVFDFGGTPIAWNGSRLNIDVFSGAYDSSPAQSTLTTAVFEYFNSDDHVVGRIGGSTLTFTTPTGPHYNEYSSNEGLGTTIDAGSLWGGSGSLYKNGYSDYASGIEGFLGFRITTIPGYRYGYFSLTRHQSTNSWTLNGFELSDVANQGIVTRSLAPASVPDAGATVLLLGGALAGLMLGRRRAAAGAAA